MMNLPKTVAYSSLQEIKDKLRDGMEQALKREIEDTIRIRSSNGSWRPTTADLPTLVGASWKPVRQHVQQQQRKVARSAGTEDLTSLRRASERSGTPREAQPRFRSDRRERADGHSGRFQRRNHAAGLGTQDAGIVKMIKVDNPSMVTPGFWRISRISYRNAVIQDCRRADLHRPWL
jgi:hypothetical protein